MEDHELLFVNKLISELFQARQIIKNMQQQVLNKPKSSKK